MTPRSVRIQPHPEVCMNQSAAQSAVPEQKQRNALLSNAFQSSNLLAGNHPVWETQ